MKQIRTNRIVQIIYPLLVYFIVYQLGVALLIDMIGDKFGKLTCLLIAGIVCIIPMFIIYQSVPKLIPEKLTNKKQLFNYCLWVIGVVCLGIALNVLLTQIGIAQVSDGFKRAENTLSDGNIIIKLLCNCLVIPILEELLLRGVITGQLYLWYGLIPSVLFSSIFFGILHNNIVQFIYALVVGIGLGVMYVKTKRLSLCIIAHCLINLIVIIFS
ncbi:CPBP family intramembrane glutamic endopeptidase [Pseudobutyrivibrio ruminis]|uniref:CPBP family intramembrane glutamic endopeptidase n=1 Tax=Pseudobutyrivibrio ruminis TaxID=46206 RepID=UPI00047FA0A7|nr:type II CAAX endopeptidase family protein [Pseudobutyrivibrio ruminis]